MHSLPTNIYSVDSVRDIDRCAIEQLGIPGYELMQRAADATFAAARRFFPDARRWQVLCGGGNNAGDGYEIARLARREGIDVSVLSLVDPATLVGDAATAYAEFAAAGGQSMSWNSALDQSADLLIDAMLGSGLQRDLAGDFAAAVEALNSHQAAVIAVDIPTGINADSGEIMGVAINAQLTVTFVGLKPGLFLGAGCNRSGKVIFDGLTIAPAAYESQVPLYRRIDTGALSHHLPPRDRNAHKGDFGHVLVIGGGPGMPGAARLSGEAALRAGAGRVSVATHSDHAAFLNATRPELMVHAVSDAAGLEALLAVADVVAFGPGLGQSEWARNVYDVVASDDRPAVWDADALNILSTVPARRRIRVITPHPGEAATLLRTTAAEVQADRPGALAGLVEKYGGVVVLKGAGTLVSSASGVPMLTTSGNPGMAVAGMGDALTGIIAALLAQGLAPDDAASIGVEVHARAGDRVAARGERGMLTSDVIAALPGIVNP